MWKLKEGSKHLLMSTVLSGNKDENDPKEPEDLSGRGELGKWPLFYSIVHN